MGFLDFIKGTNPLNTRVFNTSEYKPFTFSFKDKTSISDSYESNVDAFAMVQKISNVFKSLDWIVEQKQSDGTWMPMENSTIHELLENPNQGKGYTFQDIDEQMMVYLLCNGNSYLHGEELGGRIQEVDVLPSQNVEAITTNNFFMPNVRYDFQFGATQKKYDNGELEHIMLFNPSYSDVQDSFNGLSMFDVARKVVEVGNDRWEADAHLLKNRGIAGILTDKSQRPMTPEEAAQVQESYNRKNNGTDKFGQIKVTNKDLSFVQMAMSSTDLQLIEKGVITLRAMCNVFGLDSSLFNDPANKTFNNRKEAEKAMFTNAIKPLADKIAAKHTNFIAKNHYPDGDVRMRKDFSNVAALQGDLKMEAEKDKILMDGINVVLNMPVSNDTKQLLLKENYELSDELINSLTTQDNEQE